MHQFNHWSGTWEFDRELPSRAQTSERDVAWRVLGWELQPDEDTIWTGMSSRTGRVVAHMVGDDRLFTFEPDQLTPLDELDYCAECGQIGCNHDGRER